MADSGQPVHLSYDEIAKKLLQERLILTCLELHTELVEAGHELPRLRDYFSSPANFEICSSKPPETSSTSMNRSLSQTTLDSLDWARYSEDGERATDDKVAVLEFELRKSRETIQGLRKTLTELTVSKEQAEFDPENESHAKSQATVTSELKPHHVSTLNFLINEYLVDRGYKMTAITFADENDNQDFDNWDDVGLNIPRPPSLVQWWQGKGCKFNPTSSTECQTEDSEELVDITQLDELSEEIENLKSICLQQTDEITKLRRKTSTPHITPFGTPCKLDQSERVPSDMDCEEPLLKPEDFTPLIYAEEDCMAPFVLDSIEDAALTSTPNQPESHHVEAPQKPPTPVQETEPTTVEQMDQTDQTNPFDDAVDPRQGDRLSPLGASEEWTPQGSLGGSEFVSAQRIEAKQLLAASFNRSIPFYLENLVLNACLEQNLEVDSRLQKEVASLSLSDCNLLNLVTSSLPNIAPNVILAKREELLPLLVYAIIHQKEEDHREKLLHLLFNLTKKPDKNQRNTILLGLVCLARVMGPHKLEAELLPQCWEQLSHKHPERRLLVAQSVGVLAPYSPAPLRNSLLLSMLQHILSTGDEKEVLNAAMSSLALLIAYLDDTDKISQLTDTLLVCIDNNTDRDSTLSIHKNMLSHRLLLYTSLAQLCLDARVLGQFLDRQVCKIQSLIASYTQEMELNRKSNIDQLRKSLRSYLRYLSCACPYIAVMLIESIPDRDIDHTPLLPRSEMSQLLDELAIILGQNASEKLHTFHLAAKQGEPWSEVTQMTHTFLPNLIEPLVSLGAESKCVISSYVDLVTLLCQCFGPTLKTDVICPLFTQYFGADPQAYIDKSVLVVYIVAILGQDCNRKNEPLMNFLMEQICVAAQGQCAAVAIELSITLLLEKAPQHVESILGALWGCVVHRSPAVRVFSAGLWSLLIGHVKETDLATRVVPALVTIATDPDGAVKASSLMPLTTVLLRASNKEVCDKVKLQLEFLCEQSAVLECPHLQMAIATTCSVVGHSTPTQLLHNILLPCLSRAILEGRGSEEHQTQFGVGVLEAFSSLVSATVPNHVVAHFILPPLNQLQKTLGGASFEHMDTITSLTKEFTMRAQANSAHDKPRSTNHSVSLPHGVEDVKNRMSKIGRAMNVQVKTPSITLPSLFKRKT